MLKIFAILIVAALIESVGVAFLSGGLKEIGGAHEITAAEIFRVVKAGATNGKMILGIALEAVFFGALLYLLSKKDVSFVWPLTSLGFIFTTLAAHFILNEKVSAARWTGVLLIALGAGLTGYTEAAKKPTAPSPTAAADSAQFRAQ